MDKGGQNEGFRVLEDFICEAVNNPAVPQAAPNKRGQNENVRCVEDVALNIAPIPQEGGSPDKILAEDERTDPRRPAKSIADQLPKVIP